MTTPSAPRISEDELARLEERLAHVREMPSLDAYDTLASDLLAAARSAPAAGLDVERLQRVEAAARAFMARPGSETAEREALRAALAAEEVR